MKKVISIILVLLLTTYNISFADDLNLSGESAILIDGDTGQVLFEKNSDMKLYPASTTKIMTGILAIELGNMEDTVIIDDEIVELTDGSHIALEPGEMLKFEDLLYALLIQSANDAALAIAKHISGDIDEFVGLMNDKAKEIGALNTNFVNPNGLPHDDHVTTAHDLSLIARYAMENPKFRRIVANYHYEIPVTNKKDESRYLNSNNRLLYSSRKIDVDGDRIPIKYEGATGIKTGYTVAAQNCLVASATRRDRNLIAVVLKANGREVFADVHKLFNHGFEDYRKINMASRGQTIDNIPVSNDRGSSISGTIEKDVSAYVLNGHANDIEEVISLKDPLEAPIKMGQTLGQVEYYLGDQLLAQSNIVSTLDIEKDIPSKIISKMPNKWYSLLILLIAIILIRIRVLKRKRRKRRKSIYRMDGHIR